MSLLAPAPGADYDARAHIEAGRALAPLRNDGVLVVGSGMSFHNMRLRDGSAQEHADIFDAALTDVIIDRDPDRSEEHTSELQSLMRISYAVFCLKKKNNRTITNKHRQ